ncbi:hypothetical protein SEA_PAULODIABOLI_206 [Microbacterium phage PauloDiaboli]|nr:hypothetical protein SEA_PAULODIABOLI_206 [Microbacterium phage PauloDiaboli]
MSFSLDDLIAKATEGLSKSAADHDKKAEQAENLIDLINDPALRSQLDSLVASGAFFGIQLANRVKDIFKPDAEDTDPEPTPDPEPTEPNAAAEPSLADIFGVNDAAVQSLLDAINRAKVTPLRPSEGNVFNIFGDGERPFGGFGGRAG